MSTGTNLLISSTKNRYYVDTSEIIECVDLPISPSLTDKLTPEGQYRPLKLVVFVNTATPSTPANRTVVAYFDKFLPGHLVDITDLLLSYIANPLTPVLLSVGFSVVIQVNETFYEVPVKASIIKQFGGITNVNFSTMAQITNPDTLSFVTESTTPSATTFNTFVGLYILDVLNSSGVFRLTRTINPTFGP